MDLIIGSLILFSLLWSFFLTVTLTIAGIAIYRQYQLLQARRSWDRAVWFCLGFASNIFFPLLRPLSNESGEDRRRTNRLSQSASSRNAASTSGPERVTTYTTTIEPGEIGSLFEMLSNSIGGGGAPQQSETREEAATTTRRSRRSRQPSENG